jgi:CDP-diacylglycerol--serine O-phosphatidyltransferase
MTGLLVLTVILSYLMISTLRYRSFKDFDLRRQRRAWILPVIALVFAVIAYRPAATLLAIALVFAASGPITKAVALFRDRRRHS